MLTPHPVPAGLLSTCPAVVDDLVAAMTTAEKVGQLHLAANVDVDRDADLIRSGSVGAALFASGATAGNVRDGGMVRAAVDAVQRLAVQESRLGIPVLFGRDVLHGHRTVFPVPPGLAASFDPDLVEAASAVAAQEARDDGVLWTFAPMIDLGEDQRWGRVAESFGESPVLTGRLAAAAVRGFQGTRPSPDGAPGAGPVGGSRVAACAKHFVGYGLAAGGRDYDTVVAGENTLRNLHLRPFRAAVDAGVATVMAGFNDVDGVPMHAHRHLIREVLKQEWGFAGVVVADWGGVAQLVSHGVAADAADAARQALEAGIDLDMAGGGYLAHLADLVRRGLVDEALLDDAVRRVLTLKHRLGLLDGLTGRAGRGTGPVPVPSGARTTALRAAEAAHVLVADRGILPLDAATGRYLLTGPFVEDGAALLGTWCLDGRPEDVVTPAAAWRSRLGERGVVDDGRFGDLVLLRAAQADAVVALLGEHPSRSGETNSVSDLGLPPGQLDLLRSLTALGPPVVAVVYTGRPLALDEVLDLADAVVVCWHPGTQAGTALVRLLFGDAEPSGRLPMTFPRSIGQVPTSTHQRRTGRARGRPGATRDPLPYRTHPDVYIDAAFGSRLPFGYGLSYSRVEYGPPTAPLARLEIGGGPVRVTVAVRNEGDRPCRELVQLYAHDPVAEVTRPLIELLDWERVDLAPGQTRQVEFSVSAAQFRYSGRDLTERVDPGEIILLTGPHAGQLQPVPVHVVRSATEPAPDGAGGPVPGTAGAPVVEQATGPVGPAVAGTAGEVA